MKIAIVGSGVSGLVCAWLLHRDHDVTVYEASDWIGGHAHTMRIAIEGRSIDVDTGFIVYNERNYPNLTTLFGMLGVKTTPTTMSFSVRDDRDGLEYGGQTIRSLFAQRRNLVRPRFLRMLREITRFYREAPRVVEQARPDLTLGEFLEAGRYSRDFVERFLVPMGAAIWSSSTDQMNLFPARFFVRFFENHGMLSLKDRPQWRTVLGGSRQYVEKLTEPFRERIHLSTPVRRVERRDDCVAIATDQRGEERFDEVIFACHSDQALRLLADATPAERDILGAIPYQSNDTALHTDASLLPRRRAAWAAWNYRLRPERSERVEVTYNLSILQHLRTEAPVCVTLNQTEHVDPGRIVARMTYDHPVYTLEGIAAQGRYHEIGGAHRTHYCGAYWFNGFHEDGVRSALRVGEHFGASL